MRTNHTVDSEILRRFGAKNLRDSWYAKTNYALSYNCGEKTFPSKGRGLGLKCLRNESAEDEIYGIIEEWAAGKLLAEIEALAKHHGFGALPVENAEDAYSQPHYEERGEIQQINDPWYGTRKAQGPVPLYSGTPGYIEVAGNPIGWDTENVLRLFCGLTSEMIKELEVIHVIGKLAGADNLRDWW